MVYSPMTPNTPIPNVIWSKVSEGPRIYIPKDLDLEAIGWRVDDRLTIQPMRVKGKYKLVVVNESLKYRDQGGA